MPNANLSTECSSASNILSSISTIIQGGPEIMQQLWLLISWTSSMKHNFYVILFGRTFIFQQNDTMIISFG